MAATRMVLVSVSEYSNLQQRAYNIGNSAETPQVSTAAEAVPEQKNPQKLDNPELPPEKPTNQEVPVEQVHNQKKPSEVVQAGHVEPRKRKITKKAKKPKKPTKKTKIRQKSPKTTPKTTPASIFSNWKNYF